VAGINPSAHHSSGLAVHPGCIHTEGSTVFSLLRLLACIRRYCSHFTFSALAATACDVAGIIPWAHHSRSLCTKAVFTLSARRPPACPARLHVSDDTARTLHFLHLRPPLVIMWLVLNHRPITRAAWLCLQAAFALRALKPASLACSLCSQAAFALRAH
jgi:hypothetical protein